MGNRLAMNSEITMHGVTDLLEDFLKELLNF